MFCGARSRSWSWAYFSSTEKLSMPQLQECRDISGTRSAASVSFLSGTATERRLTRFLYTDLEALRLRRCSCWHMFTVADQMMPSERSDLNGGVSSVLSAGPTWPVG